MESPKSSKNGTGRGNSSRADSPVGRLSSNVKVLQDEASLYGLHRESSPNGFGCSQDGLEIGWGDSPEPLKIEPRNFFNTTPVNSKKKLEPKESPRSTNSLRNKRVRSSFKLPTKSPVDVAKYVAEVQELSKNIFKQISNSQETKETCTELPKDNNKNELTTDDLIQDDDDLLNECLIACTQSVESKLGICKNSSASNSQSVESKSSTSGNSTAISVSSNSQFDSSKAVNLNNNTPSSVSKLKNSGNKDSSFDKVLQSFIMDDDDWLSSAVDASEPKKTPGKGNFVKSRSDNQLVSPIQEKRKINIISRIESLNNNFRRTNSFDISPCDRVKCNETLVNKSNSVGELNRSYHPPLKKQKSFISESKDIKKINSQYTLEEIERKRLEAKLRKDRKEIERKRLEAQKRLEMKKSLNVNVMRQTNLSQKFK